MQSRTELEACVAACVLMAGGATAYHVDIDIEDFTLPVAKAVINAANDLQVIDPVLVKKHAESAGKKLKVSDVTELLTVLPTSKNLIAYIAQLKACIYNAKLEEMRQELLHKARAGSLIELAAELQTREQQLSAKYLEKPVDTGLYESSAELINRIENGIDNAALLPTGWTQLDDMLGGGLLPNELLIIAARPSVGKTAAALQIALDCERPVLLFSLEMSKAQISPRLLSAIAQANTKIATRKPSQLHPQVKNKLLLNASGLMQASERIKVIDDHDLTIEAIRRIARKEVDAGAELVILDYLQLLDKPNSQSRERAVSQISRDLKNMSKELGVPVIVLAQMNRASESEARAPRLSDLRESGAIEQDANAVLFIHKTGETPDKNKEVLLILAKGRDVGEGYRKALFVADHQRFYERQ